MESLEKIEISSIHWVIAIPFSVLSKNEENALTESWQFEGVGRVDNIYVELEVEVRFVRTIRMLQHRKLESVLYFLSILIKHYTCERKKIWQLIFI